MQKENPTHEVLKTLKLTESVNAKLTVVNCIKWKQNHVQQQSTIRLINLTGEWPKSPSIFSRKGYPTLKEFVLSNPNNEIDFIQKGLNYFLRLHSLDTMGLIPQDKKRTIPNQLFISNTGNRLSFWVDEQQIEYLLGINQVAKQLSHFDFIGSDEKFWSNQIEYGSENFMNLIQMFSLQALMQIMSLTEYLDFQFKQAEDGLHIVTSLVNYNYRYFYPPKDATRFLKKTSGIVLNSREQLKQTRSKRWAQQVLLQSIFQLRPTKCLSRILSNPKGPIFLEKYVFSNRFYTQLEKVYMNGEIQNYYQTKNIRNNKLYLTFSSRLNSNTLCTTENRPKIKQLVDEGWLKEEFHFKDQSNQAESDDEDSEQEDKRTNTKSNPQQKQIDTLYKESQVSSLQTLRNELSKKVSKTKKIEDQNQNQIAEREAIFMQTAIQLSQLSNSCRAGNVSFCYTCGFSNSKISNLQKDLHQFLNLFHYGNDSFCLSCSDLSIKDKVISQKQRLQQEVLQNETLKPQNQQTEEKDNSKEQKLVILNKSQPQKLSKQEEVTNKNEEQNFEQSIGQLMGQNNIEQNQNDQKKRGQIQQTLLEAHQNLRQKAQKQNKQNFSHSPLQRNVLFAQKYTLSWYLMLLRLKNQSNQFVSGDYFHDSFQLSTIGTQLASSEYYQDELIDVYEYYFNRMLNYIMKTNPGNETQLSSISSILQNLKHIKQIKYQRIQQNVVNGILSKCIKVSSKGTKLWSIQNEQAELTNKLYDFIDSKVQIYSAQVGQHYRTYKNIMGQQYRVTEFQLKEMIAGFQTNLKSSIIKTTQEFMFEVKWVVIFISEYVQAKTRTINSHEVVPEQQSQISFFVNQVEFLLNLLATFIHIFNQPGQIKIIEQIQSQIINLLVLVIEDEKWIKQKMKLQVDSEVIQVLVSDMLDHFVQKKSSEAKQDAKKLTTKHMDRFRPVFQIKLKTLTVKRLFNFEQQFKTFQFKLTKQALSSYANKDIFIHRNLYKNGQLNDERGFFSSLFFLHRYVQKHQRTYYHNFQIWGLMTLLSSVTEKSLKNENLAIKSSSQQQYKIKIGSVYKIIIQTLKKSQYAPQIISVYKSGNNFLLTLTTHFISQSYSLSYNQQVNEQISKKLKLYIQRARYNYLKNTPSSARFYAQTNQMLDFLFKNRNSFFNPQKTTEFQSQFHMIIQIVILNALPLFNIELAYKSEFKQIGKALKHFDVHDNYTPIQDYYLKVLSFRHDKSKEKRKKQIQLKK